MVAHHGTTYCAFFGRASESFQAASSPRVDSLYSSVLSVSTSNPRARRSRTANSHDSRSSSLDAPHCMSEALPGTHRYFCGSPLVSRSGNSLHNSAGLFSPARVAPPRNSLDYSLVVAPWQGRKSLADLYNAQREERRIVGGQCLVFLLLWICFVSICPVADRLDNDPICL